MISEVGTDLRAVRPCRRSVSADVALSEKSPHLGGAQVRLSLWQGPWRSRLVFSRTPGCSPMTSEVGTDLRAVRPCRRSVSADVALLRPTPRSRSGLIDGLSLRALRFLFGNKTNLLMNQICSFDRWAHEATLWCYPIFHSFQPRPLGSWHATREPES
jgi:hypothetical protein